MTWCVLPVLLLTVKCVSVYTASVLDCDFEQGICGYTQDTTDDVDWTLQRGQPGTTNTGPDNDHTYGNSSGHFVYLEASNLHSGDTARLVSQAFTVTDDKCLTFFYNMYGSDIDRLNVYLQNNNQPNTKITLWSRRGQQQSSGADWGKASVNLPQTSQGSYVRLVFEAIIGQSYRSDIAIDDISLGDNCNISSLTTQSTTTLITKITTKTTTKQTSPSPSTSTFTTRTASVSVPSTSPHLSTTPDLHVNSELTLTSSLPSVHPGLTKSLTINCSFSRATHSDVTSLVSLIISHKSTSGVETELATITELSNNQPDVTSALGSQVKGHIRAGAATADLSLEFTYPTAASLGRYTCKGFGFDHKGHPKVMTSEVNVARFTADCDKEVLPELRELDLRLHNLTATLFPASRRLGNHTYYLSVPVVRDVTLALSLCGAVGGVPAEVRSGSEVSAILNLTRDVDNVDVTTVLLGSRRGVNATWEFLTSRDPMTYFDWGNPSNDVVTGDCLFLGNSGKMQDGVCSDLSMVRLACEVVA